MIEPWKSESAPESGAMAKLPGVLLQAYAEVQAALQSLRHSRDALDVTTVQKLQHTSEKLMEVSSATEVAATGILDSLDRATALVDELDRLDAARNDNYPGSGADVRNKLRDELFHSISCLQFQDITAQQLRYASSILSNMEDRMAGLAAALDPATLGEVHVVAKQPAAASSQAFNPNASTHFTEIRQSLADTIFTVSI